MKNNLSVLDTHTQLLKFCLLVGLMFGAVDTKAGCLPEPAQRNIPCLACGNLQENPNRGIALTFNRMQMENALQGFMRLHGTVRINLRSPNASSPGVTFFYGIVTDSGHRILNPGAHQTLANLSRQHGFNGVFDGKKDDVGRAVAGYSAQQVNDLWAAAVRPGTGAWQVSLYDQNDRLIKVQNVARNSGSLAVSSAAGEYSTYAAYRIPACEAVDPRMSRVSRNRGNVRWLGNDFDTRVLNLPSTTCQFESYVDGLSVRMRLRCHR